MHSDTLFVQDTQGDYVPASFEQVLTDAEQLLKRRHHHKVPMSSPAAVSRWLRIHFAQYDYEAFGCLFLNNRNSLIKYVELFRGTIDSCAVYPREVAKAALACGAAHVILCHNLPSGECDPSPADEMITRRLKQALALLDISTVDHIVVGGTATYSFAEHGLL